jgi:RNA polymerase sigma factor (sigma-70 family)
MAGVETHARTIEPAPEDVLIRQVEAGDEIAFRDLYERYFPRIFRFVQRRIDNRADVEETVQEVFVNIFSSIGSYRREAPFQAWVLGLTRRTIARRFKRKRHPTVPLPSEANEIAEPAMPTIQREATPLEHYECQERLAAIRVRAERDLSDEQRDLFARHHLQDEPVREIAALLRKSEDSVKSTLYRARKLLFAS